MRSNIITGKYLISPNLPLVVAMTICFAEATMLNSASQLEEQDLPVTVDPVPEDDLPVTTDPVPEFDNIWDWLEANADGIYSHASYAVRHAQYVSLADDLSRFIAEKAPADLIGPLRGLDADEVTAEWREGARQDILNQFEQFDLDELFDDIMPIQLEHAEYFLCNIYGDCRLDDN